MANGKVSINAAENWGRLVNPAEHDAAAGYRLCDNRMRELTFFGNRMTVVGDEKLAKVLQRHILRSALRAIKKNTHYAWGVSDANEWHATYMIGGKKNIEVKLDVRCAGEYCHVAAYADVVPKLGTAMTSQKGK